MKRTMLLAALAALMATGCGGDDESCEVGKADACDDGLVCEAVAGEDDGRCFPETVITGRVLEASDNAGVAGARVVALDATTNAPVGAVVTTDATGAFRIPVKFARSVEEGTPDVTSGSFTLRVEAEGYLSFPSPIRQAVPLTVNRADDKDALPVNQRDVVLLALEGVDVATLGSIAGKVSEGTAGQGGVLVVAEPAAGQTGLRAVSTVTDPSGDYRLLNLRAGTYDVRAYLAGKAFAPATGQALAAAEDKAGVNLAADASQLTTVSGTANFVNAPAGATETSIVLALASTGEVPRGLSVMTLNKAFSVAGVPPGTYDILASYTNDNLVLDPDPSQLPRPIRVTLPQDAVNGVLATGSFKVTGDVGIVSPGKNDAPGEPAVSAAGLTFTWQDDSSEDFYGLELFDAYGTRIWGSEPSTTVRPAVEAAKNVASKAYDGPALTPGQTYQWRVTSWSACTSSCNGALYKPISRSENLRGIFTVAQ